jgi:hypothetical protein
MIPADEVMQFLEISSKKNYFNDNTIQSRRTACKKFFDILDEDQKTVEYVQDHIELIKTQFGNRFPEVRGNTVDVYAARVQLVLRDFLAWKADRAAWERDVAGRQGARSSSGDAEKRTRPEKPSAASPPPRAEDPNVRVVKIPLPARDIEVEVTIPRDLTVSDLKRILWALLPYAGDWDPNVSPGVTFPQLESSGEEVRQ